MKIEAAESRGRGEPSIYQDSQERLSDGSGAARVILPSGLRVARLKVPGRRQSRML